VSIFLLLPLLSVLDGPRSTLQTPPNVVERYASAVPADHPRRQALEAAAREHREAGLRAVSGKHYEGGHWLGTFATYLVTRRGMR
jgi:Protein of unknown function (DUF2891)